MRLEHVTDVHADALLSELAMSHRDLANLLRTALKAVHPGDRTYVWPRDVYDDAVVYELTDRDAETETLYQRSYTIADGTVTLGDPIKVVAVTQYMPAEQGATTPPATTATQLSQPAEEARRLHEAAYTGDAKSCYAYTPGDTKSDWKLPICNTAGDVDAAIVGAAAAALSSGGFRGRRVQIPADALAGVKRKLRTAWRKANPDKEAADMPDSIKEAAEELTSDLVPLVEKADKQDGTISLRIIAPGQGSSGYYPADMLKRDGPKVFTAGLHMYADHPSLTEESDRPERSIKDLVGTLSSDARWEDNGAAGPGLYAEAKLRGDVAPLIEDLAPHIGVSIRALGTAGTREIDGQQTRTIEAITQAKSVDFVTVPGAGGRVLDLIEAARQGYTPAPVGTEDNDVSKEELEEAQRKIEEQAKQITALEAWKAAEEARQAEARLIREAHGIVTETLAGIQLPVPTRERLAARLATNPPTKDGALDKEALVTAVKEAAQAEVEYLASVTGTSGTVTGMGGEPPKPAEAPSLDESDKRIAEALKGI